MLLPRVCLAIGVLALPVVAAADDNAVVTPPPPPTTAGPPPATAPPPTTPPPVPPPRQPAPAPAPKRTTVGADLALVLPLGDYRDLSDIGVGGLLRIAYTATPEVAVTLRFGYIWHKTDVENTGLGMVPVVLGGMYKFTGGPFAYGEVGINMIRASTTFMGFTGTDSTTYLSFGAGGGYAVGKVQARLGLWMPGRPEDMTGHHTLFGVLGSVGFDFNAF